MNKKVDIEYKKVDIIKTVLEAFEFSWGRCYFPDDLGTEKHIKFKDRVYTMFPKDFKIALDLIKMLGYEYYEDDERGIN